MVNNETEISKTNLDHLIDAIGPGPAVQTMMALALQTPVLKCALLLSERCGYILQCSCLGRALHFVQFCLDENMIDIAILKSDEHKKDGVKLSTPKSLLDEGEITARMTSPMFLAYAAVAATAEAELTFEIIRKREEQEGE
ncbi:MAG: hypothetical protein KOO60_07270 [Gemmatimonadales bacterium]|nr:hypothetical protein [Gemmatimonadales bacterium]